MFTRGAGLHAAAPSRPSAATFAVTVVLSYARGEEARLGRCWVRHPGPALQPVMPPPHLPGGF